MPGGWEGLGLCPELCKAVEQDLDWIVPMDVQDEAIPLILGGGDVMVAAETGSGKTGAFGLPIVQLVMEARRQAMAEASGGKAKARPANTEVCLNGYDRDAICSLSNGNMRVQCSTKRGWGGVRANAGVTKGKYYYEATVEYGLARVGWSTCNASLNLGCCNNGFGFGGTAKKSHGSRFDPYGETFEGGDTLGCFLDMDEPNKEISFSKNGKYLDTAFKLPKGFRGPLHPAVVIKQTAVQLNFGAKHSPPLKYLDQAKRMGYTPLAMVSPMHVRMNAGQSVSKKHKAAGRVTPRAIVIAPTKDLAEQIFKDISGYARFVLDPPLQLVLLMGGINYDKAANKLKVGVDIVVGTPGTTVDFVQRNKLDTDNVQLLVLDEADRLCDREGQKQIGKLFDKLPKTGVGSERLQVCFFSATLHSKEIKEMSTQLCHHPVWVDLKGKDSVPDTVHHVVIRVDATADRSWLGRTPPKHVVCDGVHANDSIPAKGQLSPEAMSEGVKRLKPLLLRKLIDKLDMNQCLIFMRTNLDCDNMEKFLTACGGGRKFQPGRTGGKENPYSCAVLAGMRQMHERRANLEAFKKGECRFLICTDVAARGIDIKGLPYVVNVTLPDQSENYIHRIGRVGRADSIGVAISLVAACKEKVWYYDKKKWRNKRLSTELAVINKFGAPVSGGCCTWYDEPDMLLKIQKRLGSTIPSMQKDLSLPADISAAVKRGVHFGKALGAEAERETLERLGSSDMKSHLTQLTDLEVRAQHFFLRTRQRFNGMSKKK